MTVDTNTLINAGETVGRVTFSAPVTDRSTPTSHSFIRLQVIPPGVQLSLHALHNLDNSTPVGNGDMQIYFLNTPTSYHPTFFPPRYCTGLEWESHWKSLCPNPCRVQESGGEREGENERNFKLFSADVAQMEKSALEKRKKYFANVQEHYFKMPPNIERGYKQFLYDIYGRAYLDMVNNVAVLGHSHTAITNTVNRQLSLLNTNSRFIYSVLGQLAEEIVSTIPLHIRQQGRLNNVFLVNSGSEATDLAMRIARAVATERRRRKTVSSHSTGEEEPFRLHRDLICLAGAYHGVTTASDEVSTTLNDNPRSLETRAPWIHLVPMPNLFRGLHRHSTPSVHHDCPNDPEVDKIASIYAGYVEEKVDALVKANTPPSVFICEPLSGNAGGVEIPKGYLKRVYEKVRSVGGLCICDEVQVGYGRLGDNFWGFMEHDVIPDIITMAKAAGNGHPFGFVITSSEIATEFGADGSFFSSAGGGPVSCSVGLAVLDTLKKEKLQDNARITGAYLNTKLKQLAAKHSHIIGCIHGHGLYQGIELVRNAPSSGLQTNEAEHVNSKEPKEPATKEAYAICERLLELGVICHNTGDYSNVLKVKPPLCFSKEDADYFVEALDITFQSGW